VEKKRTRICEGVPGQVNIGNNDLPDGIEAVRAHRKLMMTGLEKMGYSSKTGGPLTPREKMFPKGEGLGGKLKR